MAHGSGRRPITASAYVADLVRDGILRGRYRLGERLDQQVLAEELGVSIIPVREALHRLAADGLVRILPRRGAFVAELTRQELTEISWIRERLEERATRLAAPHLEERTLRELSDLNDRMRRMARPGKVQASSWAALNRRWHFGLYEAAQSELLVQLIDMLWNRTSLYREVIFSDPTIRAKAAHEHGDVLRRLQLGDVVGAARGVRLHVRRATEDMMVTESSRGTEATARS